MKITGLPCAAPQNPGEHSGNETCDYAEAYRRLIFSMGESMVYNPTMSDLYFEREGEIFRIAPGETVE